MFLTVIEIHNTHEHSADPIARSSAIHLGEKAAFDCTLAIHQHAV